VKEILASYKRPEIDTAKERELHDYVLQLANEAGMEMLPLLDEKSPLQDA
jgi:hypothetical protein